MDFKNRIALITGANRGIGKTIVNGLLSRGIKKIYACARNINELPDFGDTRISPLQLDITDEQQIKQSANAAQDIDLLINNAGIAAIVNLLEGPMELIKRDMETNYFGTLTMLRAFVPVLETKSNSVIVNIASISAFSNFPKLGGYSASKAALFSLSQSMRTLLANRNIVVHTVNPGPIDTDMAKEYLEKKTSPEAAVASMLEQLENDVADIFPDTASQQMFGLWKQDYRQLENMVRDMYNSERQLNDHIDL